MNFCFIFQFCLYFCTILYGISSSSVFELFSENERIGNTIASYDMKSAHACLILCNITNGCSSVNFHEGNEKCLLTDNYPEEGSSSGTSESGWKIYFIRKPIHRHTGFVVSVANTRDDIINNRGTSCGSYTGPAISSPPFTLTIPCAEPIYGKVLKIKHDNANYLQFCEVVVHTG